MPLIACIAVGLQQKRVQMYGKGHKHGGLATETRSRCICIMMNLAKDAMLGGVLAEMQQKRAQDVRQGHNVYEE